MSMCTSIISVRNKNIRHVYFGRPGQLGLRGGAEYPNQDQLRMKENLEKMKKGILQASKDSYTPPQLDPAPAFRCVSRGDAEKIGERLYNHRNTANKDKEEASDEPGKKPSTTKGPSGRLHNLTFAADIKSHRRAIDFIGKHRYVNDVAVKQMDGL